MNKTIPTAISKTTTVLTLILTATTAMHSLSFAGEVVKNGDINTWPMFQKVDVVDLAAAEIPDGYRRAKITDNKGRSIAGEWLVIDRAAKHVKFQRESDGSEFTIPFDQLSARDLTYAQLENGIVWDTGEKPLIPLDMISFYDFENPGADVPPSGLVIGKGSKIVSAEVIGNDSVKVTSHTPNMAPDRSEKVAELPIEFLTENDRNLIKQDTGVQVPVLPRPAWCPDTRGYWKQREVIGKSPEGRNISSSIKYPIFSSLTPTEYKNTIALKDGSMIKADYVRLTSGTTLHVRENGKKLQYVQFDDLSDKDRRLAIEAVSKLRQSVYEFDPTEPQTFAFGSTQQKALRQKTLISKAFDQLLEAYTPEEIIAHLQAKTLTLYFLAAYDDNWRGQYGWVSDPKIRPEVGMIEFSARALPLKTPDNEKVSLRGKINELGLKPYAGKAHKSHRGKFVGGTPLFHAIRTNHFVANFINQRDGKPELSMEDFVAKFNKELGIQADGGKDQRIVFNSDEVMTAIAKVNGIKYQPLYPLCLNSRNPKLKDFEEILCQMHLHNQLRQKNPVSTTSPDGKKFYVLTGFERKQGAETVYEAIVFEVIQPGADGNDLKIYDQSGIPASELVLPSKLLW